MAESASQPPAAGRVREWLTGGGVVRITVLAVIYALLARLGLALDPVGGFATAVWAPTGLAIAATLLLGYRLAPGIWLGAFAANLLSGASPIVAGMIAVGNTLEAVAATYLLRRLPEVESLLRRVRDVISFALVAMAAPLISATIGVVALHLAGTLSAAQTPEAWRVWWVGDSVGALLVAPFLLAWRSRGTTPALRSRMMEGAAMLACLGALSVIVFFGEPSRGVGTILQPYVVFPLLIWASLRFEERGAVTAILIVAMIAIAGTARGYGPFAQPDLGESLFALQAFTGTVAVCFLMLGAAIAERTRLQATVTAALAGEAASNRAKSDFLAAMSHELRTPLNAIAGYAELLTTGIHGPLSPQQADAIARIDRNQRHLTALLGDVLTFTRSGEQTGSTRLKLENVSVADALQELGAFVEGDLTRQKVSFHVDPPEPSLEVYVDRDKLRQILLNLLVNAIKFSPAGASVSITSRRDGDRVWIAVTDAGPGIPTDQLGRVFEAFYQVERGHTRRYPGLGLGLTIARDLARAMGGDVVIERSDVRGTTASLVLPHAHAVQPSS